MGQHVERASGTLLQRCQNVRSMVADGAVERDVLVGDQRGFVPGRLDARRIVNRAQCRAHPRERPAQVDRGGPGRRQLHACTIQMRVAGILGHRQCYAVCGSGADQRRAADPHRADRFDRVVEACQRVCCKRMGQARLIDDPGEALLRISPDAAVRYSVDFHARGYTIAGRQFPGSRMDASIYDIRVKTIDGKQQPMSKYKGKVLLIVNTASQCGLTPQYKGLEELHKTYAKRGLAVLGFPCNQFGEQEPGDEAEIASFCERNYGVSLPDVLQDRRQRRSHRPVVRISEEGAAGAARQRGDQVELHQVPRRHGWKCDSNALRRRRNRRN
jgi:glutathione peroxidase-family protein